MLAPRRRVVSFFRVNARVHNDFELGIAGSDKLTAYLVVPTPSFRALPASCRHSEPAVLTLSKDFLSRVGPRYRYKIGTSLPNDSAPIDTSLVRNRAADLRTDLFLTNF